MKAECGEDVTWGNRSEGAIVVVKCDRVSSRDSVAVALGEAEALAWNERRRQPSAAASSRAHLR